MRRRDFITLLSGTAAAWPLSAHTQQSTKRLIGVLSNPSGDPFDALFPAFHRGLSENGYVEGQNVAIEYRFADGQVDRLPALAADLVNRNIAVLVAFTNPTALAAKLATTTIPIVFIIGGDPVKLGLVGSLNRPAGNITGITFFSTQMESKRLGLLHELIPHAKLIAVLINPSQPAAAAQGDEVAAAARALGLRVSIAYRGSKSARRRTCRFGGRNGRYVLEGGRNSISGVCTFTNRAGCGRSPHDYLWNDRMAVHGRNGFFAVVAIMFGESIRGTQQI